MKKFLIICFILLLTLSTAFIKNSTKRIDDEIFGIKENLRILENEYGKLKLEYNYLSSAENLMNFNSKFFNNNLSPKKLNEISLIDKYE